jgi:hypothetical protein
MVSLQVAPHTLGAQHATVEGKLFPGLKTNNLVAANLQLNAALLAAETAMSLHEPVDRLTRHITPPSRRSVVEMGPELTFKLFRRLG